MAIGYRCEGCGIVRADKWQGTCPGCGGYYSIRRTASASGTEEGPPPRGQIVALGDVSAAAQDRISCGFPGIDKILGSDPVTGKNGIAAKAGQAVQFFGEPGSGKSTLLTQMFHEFAKQREVVLYVAAEENLQQIKTRASRLFDKFPTKLLFVEENDLDAILSNFDEIAPTVVAIDSINAISVEDYQAGSIQAMRLAARELYKFTQSRGIGMFLVTQVNKAGNDFAGPKEVEHILDTSLSLRLDRDGTRVLACTSKNRFGPTPAEQRFKMLDTGLVEIENPEPPALPAPSPPTLISVP